MRLTLQDGPLAAIRTTVESRFASSLPSEDTLARAWADPAVRFQIASDGVNGLGRALQATAMDAFANVQARVGTSIGVPGTVVTDFARSIAADALEDGVVNWAGFAKSGVQAVTDIALDAMGAVPIVGWIAKAALTIVNAIIDAATRDEPRPLLLEYSRDADEDAAQNAIDRLGQLHSASNPNWNPLFLPAGRGPWVYTAAENGYVVRPSEPSEGLGGIPSGVTGFRALQVRSWPGILEALASAQHSAAFGLEAFNPEQPTSNRVVASKILATTDDIFSQLPSLQRVILAAWSAASTNSTAAVFNLQPGQIRQQWREHVENGLAFARQYEKSTAQPKALSLAVDFSLRRQRVDIRLPPGAMFAGRPLGVSASRLRLDFITDAWCEFLERRQAALIRTPAVAFCSEQQFAFAMNPVLRARLLENRRLFLTTRDADEVDPADIVDLDFRREVVLYRGPRSGRMPGTASVPKTPPNLPPALVGVAMPTSTGGGAVLAALLVGAAWLAVRGRR